MKNKFLRINLTAAKILIRLKQGLVFLYTGFLGKLLERIGYFLAHIIFFPVYRLFDRMRRAYLKRFGSFQATVIGLLGSRTTFVVVLGVCAAIMLGTETRAFGSVDYASGKYSLFSVYVGPGEEDFGVVEETGAPQGYIQGQNNSTVGVSVPAGLPGATVSENTPPMDIINYDQTAVVSRDFIQGAPPPSSLGPREGIVEYDIAPGDTLGGIAAQFNISLSTLAWENKLTAHSVLQIGQKLRILPVSGVSHKVKKGDSLARIAKLYGVKPEAIVSFNKVDDAHLAVGAILIVPGGKQVRTAALPSSQLAAPGIARGRYLGGTPPPSLLNAGEGMIWPTAVHYISQYFKLHHPGIDIAGPVGTPIYAADNGTVVAAGWNNGGYGNMILIDHNNGFMTRYGHSSQLLVEVSEHVSKGQVISLMGSTGRSTGSHLHFEVIAGGVRVNPFLYVR